MLWIQNFSVLLINERFKGDFPTWISIRKIILFFTKFKKNAVLKFNINLISKKNVKNDTA